MRLQKVKDYKYVSKIIAIFSQGLTVKEIILSAILGSLIGIMPVLGIATITVTFLALRFHLNLAVAILFSYLVAPLQILLFFDFIHLGERVFFLKESVLTFDAIKIMFQKPLLHIIKELWIEITCGFVGWSAIAIPIFVIIASLSNKKNTT